MPYKETVMDFGRSLARYTQETERNIRADLRNLFGQSQRDINNKDPYVPSWMILATIHHVNGIVFRPPTPNETGLLLEPNGNLRPLTQYDGDIHIGGPLRQKAYITAAVEAFVIHQKILRSKIHATLKNKKKE